MAVVEVRKIRPFIKLYMKILSLGLNAFITLLDKSIVFPGTLDDGGTFNKLSS